eukprot:GHVT01045152.1.p1 GENE.GHVT01045152.1~~GHVT01045152.1.p1  ORF type:complete len:209 (-),score=37.90 GHVT01045152.1:1484-2110(-)
MREGPKWEGVQAREVLVPRTVKAMVRLKGGGIVGAHFFFYSWEGIAIGGSAPSPNRADSPMGKPGGVSQRRTRSRAPIRYCQLVSTACTTEQLALGFRIVSNAYRTRVAAQEGEIRSLKAQNAEKSEQVQSLQKKNSGLEVQLIEATQRGNQLADENKQLIATIKKLHKDINRLESLKKAVLNSIQEDHGGSDESHKVSAAQHLRCND